MDKEIRIWPITCERHLPKVGRYCLGGRGGYEPIRRWASLEFRQTKVCAKVSACLSAIKIFVPWFPHYLDEPLHEDGAPSDECFQVALQFVGTNFPVGWLSGRCRSRSRSRAGRFRAIRNLHLSPGQAWPDPGTFWQALGPPTFSFLEQRTQACYTIGQKSYKRWAKT
jgi:hypothetical protein